MNIINRTIFISVILILAVYVFMNRNEVSTLADQPVITLYNKISGNVKIYSCSYVENSENGKCRKIVDLYKSDEWK